MSTNAAVIGTGFIGPVHVEALRRAGVNVIGILGSSTGKSVAAAERMQIGRAYQSLSELLNDAEVDSVHITSPNKYHFEQASACLRSGKHVMCEKPLAMNSEESTQLVALAERSGVAAGVNYNIRYYPLCLEATERRRQGELGDIFHVVGSYSQDWLFHRHDFNWRVNAADGGPLRALADIGTHWMDLVQAISGLEVEAVFADLQTVYKHRDCPVGSIETFSGKMEARQPDDTYAFPVDTEDAGSVLLRFRGGSRGQLHVSQVSAGRKNCLRFEVAGSKQALSWNSENPNELWIGHRNRSNEILTRDPALMKSRASQFAHYPGGHNEGFADTFKQLFIDFYQSIADESYRSKPLFPTFSEGHREVQLCEAILLSAKHQKWISLP
ncbi:MAG: Gfo/Idh/MocA family oxidoreductase [Planctomycetota bacterium]